MIERRRPAWPDGARGVLCVTIHMDGPAVEIGEGRPPIGIDAAGVYAARRGVPRMLDILATHDVPATFFMCGHDAELYPGLMRDVARAGHEIAAHGYLHEDRPLGAEEPELLGRTHAILGDIVGEAPVGWCSPSGRKSAQTLGLLRTLGYIYDASEKDRDRPYRATIAGQAAEDFVILPNNTVSLDDAPLYEDGHASAAEALDTWLGEFETLMAGPGYVHLTVHARAGYGSGTPARARAFGRFLAEVRSVPGLAILTCRDLARHLLDDRGLSQ